MDKIKRINLNGDGAAWIKTGAKVLPKTKFVLDKFHMHKYIIAATSHLADSAEEVIYSAFLIPTVNLRYPILADCLNIRGKYDILKMKSKRIYSLFNGSV